MTKSVSAIAGTVEIVLTAGGAFLDTPEGQAYVPGRIAQAYPLRPGDTVDVVVRPNYEPHSRVCPLFVLDLQRHYAGGAPGADVDLDTRPGLRDGILHVLEEEPLAAGSIARELWAPAIPADGLERVKAMCDELYASGTLYRSTLENAKHGTVAIFYGLYADYDLPGEPPAPE